MSRTYRLRHVRSAVADKFVDGNVQRCYERAKELATNILVHQILEYKCQYIGTHVGDVTYSDYDIGYHATSVSGCDHRLCINDNWRRWSHKYYNIVEAIVGKLPVASIWRNSFTGHVPRNRNDLHVITNRAARRKDKNRIKHAISTRQFEEDEIHDWSREKVK